MFVCENEKLYSKTFSYLAVIQKRYYERRKRAFFKWRRIKLVTEEESIEITTTGN